MKAADHFIEAIKISEFRDFGINDDNDEIELASPSKVGQDNAEIEKMQELIKMSRYFSKGYTLYSYIKSLKGSGRIMD